MMQPQEIAQMFQPRTFRPFRVHVSDGPYYDVKHLCQCIPSPRTLPIGIPGENLPPLSEDWAFVDVIHITRIRTLLPSVEEHGQAPT